MSARWSTRSKERSPVPALPRRPKAARVEFTLLAALAIFASLEAALGICVGCKAFYRAMRLGLVPPAVCEDGVTAEST